MLKGWVLFGVLLFSTAFSSTLELSKAKSEVSFLAIGQPSALKIRGIVKDEKAVSGSLVVDGGILSGTAILNLSALNTGIELRDQHMKEKYLEVPKYQTAELQFTKPLIEGSNDSIDLQLKLHGVTQSVKGKGKVLIENSKLNLNLEFSFSLKDFLIEIPSYLGIKVANEVKVTASSEGMLL